VALHCHPERMWQTNCQQNWRCCLGKAWYHWRQERRNSSGTLWVRHFLLIQQMRLHLRREFIFLLSLTSLRIWRLVLRYPNYRRQKWLDSFQQRQILLCGFPRQRVRWQWRLLRSG
jgi:hypothetical protein